MKTILKKNVNPRASNNPFVVLPTLGALSNDLIIGTVMIKLPSNEIISLCTSNQHNSRFRTICTNPNLWRQKIYHDFPNIDISSIQSIPSPYRSSPASPTAPFPSISFDYTPDTSDTWLKYYLIAYNSQHILNLVYNNLTINQDSHLKVQILFYHGYSLNKLYEQIFDSYSGPAKKLLLIYYNDNDLLTVMTNNKYSVDSNYVFNFTNSSTSQGWFPAKEVFIIDDQSLFDSVNNQIMKIQQLYFENPNNPLISNLQNILYNNVSNIV